MENYKGIEMPDIFEQLPKHVEYFLSRSVCDLVTNPESEVPEFCQLDDIIDTGLLLEELSEQDIASLVEGLIKKERLHIITRFAKQAFYKIAIKKALGREVVYDEGDYFLLGVCLQKLGHHQKALDAFETYWPLWKEVSVRSL